MRKSIVITALLSGMSLPLASIAAGPDTMPMEKPSAATPTPSRAPGAEGRPASPLFDQLDANKDGAVDAKEAGRSATVQANFKALDIDKDGRISASEWSSAESGGVK